MCSSGHRRRVMLDQVQRRKLLVLADFSYQDTEGGFVLPGAREVEW